MEMLDNINNLSFVSIDSTEDMCLICFTNQYTIHELKCCKKLICTNCVKEWVNKQPLRDSLCVFCQRPNYIFQQPYISLDQEEYRYNCICIFLCTMLLLCGAIIYIFASDLY